MACPLIDSLESEVKQEFTNKSVLGGLIGAVGGYIIADQLKFKPFATVLCIGTGHFTGHFIGDRFFK